MGSNPINLILRFLLELAALYTFGLWGWRHGEGWTRVALAMGLVLLMVALWGVFNVPGDPSRSGGAPVIIPGLLRLLIELLFFALASWALLNLGYNNLWWIFATLVGVHYLLSYDRIQWLLKN